MYREEEPRGDSQVALLLNQVTVAEVEELMDELADLMIEKGLAKPGLDGDIRALVVAQGYEFATDPEQFVRKITEEGWQTIIIPGKGRGGE